MNVEKLKRLQAQVRIGGKGTPRRKKKVTHQTAATDDKKLQSSLKKLSVSTIPGIEEVNIIKDDLTVIHFNNPKAQASLSANTFAVTGHGETKKIVEMLPEILPQLGQETVAQLRIFANSMSSGQNQMPKAANASAIASATTDDFADDVPLLVEDFDQIANQEASFDPKGKSNNNKTKNKSKGSVEDRQKSDKQPMLGVDPVQTGDIKSPIVENAEKPTERVEIKSQTANQKPSEPVTQGIEVIGSKASHGEKPKNQKEPKKEIPKESKPQKNTATLASGTKNVENQETKKISPQSPNKNKDASKDANQKEKDSHQPNKKNSTKDGQQSQKNQNTKQTITAIVAVPPKGITSTEPDIKNSASKELVQTHQEKDALKNINVEKPLQAVNIQMGEKSKSSTSWSPSQEIVKTNEATAISIEKTTESNTTSEKIQPTLEMKEPIKVVALPMPPIIPPRASELNLSPEAKLNAPELETKTDSIKLESIDKGNVTQEDAKNAIKSQEPKAPLENVAKEQPIVVAAERNENLSEVSPTKSTSETIKDERKSEKIPQNDGAVKKVTPAPENQEIATKRNEKPIASNTQPKTSGVAQQQQQPNQKPISPKEATKKPAPQQQKQVPETKKAGPSSENKKEGEKPKGKQNIAKPQSSNANNVQKSQPAAQQQTQQQQVKKPAAPPQASSSSENGNGAAKAQQVPTHQQQAQKTPCTPTTSVSEGSNTNTNTTTKPETQKTQQQQQQGQKTAATAQTSGKPNEKPAGTTKPTSATKTSTPMKKPAATGPMTTAANTKAGNSASSAKNKPNPTASKSATQGPPKPDKAHGNVIAGAPPPPKSIDQQAKPPKADANSASTPVEKQ